MADVPAADAPVGEVVEDMGGTPSFSMEAPLADPMRPTIEPKPAPAGVPEKFWDADKGVLRSEDLLKSYAELEKKLSAPKDPADPDPADPAPEADPADPADPANQEGDPNKDPDPDPAEGDPEGGDAQVALAEAMEVARTAYAETGELSTEVRAPFLAAGISDAQIDLYLQGVKAHEAGLKQAAVKAAGVEDYGEVEKAIEWAAKNWSPKKIEAFNAQAGDVETVPLAVTALFNDYRAAEPGEGRLTNINGGTNRGDVYTDRGQFDKDLAAADAARDRVARKEAIAKLDRSIKAKTLK